MMTTTDHEPGTAALAGRREWIGLAVLALPTLLLSLDMSVLYLALPYLSADLGASATQQLWIMDVYGFMIAGFLITMGTLGDRIGRRRLLMTGGFAFAAASVAAAYSTTPEMLIATRALLGVAGATLMPSTLALITTMFRDRHQRGVAIGVWMTCFMGGMTVGPLVGGALLEAFWWGSAFLLGVPVMMVLLVAAPVLLPENRDDDAGRLDLVSVLLSLVAILPVVYGLKELAAAGVTPGALLSVVVGVAFGVGFVRRQGRLDDPLLDISLFANRQFSTALAMNLGGGIVMAGNFLLLTQFLQLVEGLSPLRAGLTLAPLNVAMAVASIAAPQLARRYRPAYAMAGGSLVAAIGMLVVTQAGATGGAPTLLVGFALACVGIAVPSSLGMNLIMGAVAPEKAGSASAMSETSGELGIALGVAVIGSVTTAIYRSTIDLPGGLSAAASRAAGESLPGAVDSSGSLTGSAADQVLVAAREAFVSGIQMAGVFGALVFAAMAVATLLVFRHLRPYGEETAVSTATESTGDAATESTEPATQSTEGAATESTEPALVC